MALGGGSGSTLFQSPGTAVDFGDRNVVWTTVDPDRHDDPSDVLAYACGVNGYAYETDSSGRVSEINGKKAGSGYSWDLWAVKKGDTAWTKLDLPYKDKISSFTVTSWAYCKEGEKPTVGTDAAGNSIYGYKRTSRTVSLAPSITEMIGGIGAESTLVGTDRYSNHPETVVAAQNRGDIKIVGDFTNPIYESIINVKPDLVLCDGAQYAHYQMSERLRGVFITSILLYGGTDIGTILDNIYIIGKTTGYDMASEKLIKRFEYDADKIFASSAADQKRVMISLSADTSTWVSGKNTYVHGMVSGLSGTNVFEKMNGWVHINPEMINSADPETIVIISDMYKATQEEYGAMMQRMSSQWKSTEAYREGSVFLICGKATDMASRAGPRSVQLLELLSMFIGGEPDIPKYIGDDYRDYLKITKDM